MPPFFQVDGKKSSLTVKGLPSGGDWERVFAVMKEYGITRLHASGLTDPSVQLLAKLDQVISLTLRSDVLTDDGLAHLASMPQLCELEISGPNITDRGLQVLRHLSNLRRFQSCWTQAISDAGAANLASCDLIESVNLLGTAAGDGLIAALAGKLNLRQLKTGYGVSDAGIKILQQIPAFKTWLAEDVRYCLMSAETQPNHLLIDGPFTDAGLADLAGLEGLFGLSFFRHSEFFTAAGLAPLRLLPNLGFFGCPGTRCDDEALSHIAAMPHLRMLLGQGAVAGDAGWKRLSQSQTIEYIWGRDCPNFTSSGLYALAAMPALRGIGISCKQVDDAALSTLPSFPALRHLMPMDVSDSGFRHLGRCEKLEGLWCMYCRDTGDVATAHIEPLSRLKTYYAGMTKITDRSLEILSRMLSLENLEFYGCNEITDRGIAHLAKLPQLYEISVQSSTRVSAAAAALFPPHVSVSFSG
jgi:hypothetical protein